MQFTAPLRVSALACLASLSALGLVAFGTGAGEGLVERSVADAIDRMELRGAAAAVTRGFDPSHIHLTNLSTGPGPGSAVAVGDRMTLAQRDGGSATYEVVEVRPLARQAVGAGADDGPKLMLVTAVATAGRMPAQTIRFIFDGDAKDATAFGKPHAL